MKLFYGYLKSFLKEDFNTWYYLITLLFIAGAIIFNYTVDFEDGILDNLPGALPRTLAFLAFYMVSYSLIILLNRIFYPKNTFHKQKKFWLKIFLGFFILSFDTAIHLSGFISFVPLPIRYLVLKILNNLMSLFTYLLPLWFIYRYIDKNNTSYYGLTTKGFNLIPYLQLFLIVIPLVIAASFIENFSSYYPVYKQNPAAEYWGIASWIPALGYELTYGWNFISVELLFRGFFVIGMLKMLGRHAVVPMVVAYCFIHFGKPVGECISSIFGGYMLGIIAYYSRNIMGGIIIHIGLAWLMELVSMLN